MTTREALRQPGVTYQHISVPLDGSDESRFAVSQAIGLARSSGATVELIAAVFPAGTTDLSSSAVESDGLWLHNADSYLEDEAKLFAAVGVSATRTLLEGSAERELTDYLDASSTDLVVIATRDRTRLERLLDRSVAAHVMRHTSKPILMLHAGRSDSAPTSTIGRILVALDGSALADQILPHAAGLAALTGAEITLLTVIPPMLAVAATAGLGESMLGGAPVAALPTDRESARRERNWLEERARSLRDRGLTVDIDVTLHENAGRALVGYAEKHAMDVIALSTHGRGALKRLVMGSVATHVLHASHAKLLVVKPVGAAARDRDLPVTPARARADRVDEAGRESFPASDPPSWNSSIARLPDED